MLAWLGRVFSHTTSSHLLYSFAKSPLRSSTPWNCPLLTCVLTCVYFGLLPFGSPVISLSIHITHFYHHFAASHLSSKLLLDPIHLLFHPCHITHTHQHYTPGRAFLSPPLWSNHLHSVSISYNITLSMQMIYSLLFVWRNDLFVTIETMTQQIICLFCVFEDVW